MQRWRWKSKSYRNVDKDEELYVFIIPREQRAFLLSSFTLTWENINKWPIKVVQREKRKCSQSAKNKKLYLLFFPHFRVMLLFSIRSFVYVFLPSIVHDMLILMLISGPFNVIQRMFILVSDWLLFNERTLACHSHWEKFCNTSMT